MTDMPIAKAEEEALLGALLIYPDDINRCVLQPEHFIDWQNREVFEIIRKLNQDGKEPNYYTVGDALVNKGAFEGVYTRLEYLRDSYYYQETFDQLEFLILEAYRKRQAIQELSGELARCYKTNEVTEDIFSDMLAKITKISDPLLSEDNSLDALREKIEERAKNPTKIYGLETGFAEFDRQTHGLQKKEMFLLTGQPGSGKSLLAGQLGFGMAKHGHAGLFYSLEMSAEALYMRQLSVELGIFTDRLKEGWDMYGELDHVREKIEELRNLPITIREQIGWTPVKLRADIARMKMLSDIEFVIVDYMDLLVDPDADDYIEKSENISQNLHNLALEFDVALLVVQSLTKQGYGSNPGLSSLSGSHKVSFVTDQVAILVGNPEEKVKELRWLKVRHADDTRNLKLMLKHGLPEFVPVIEKDDQYNEVYRG